ncbi:cell wall protein DAN4, partial [Biomphalaria glabrata]
VSVWFGANDIDVEGTWIWDHNKQSAYPMASGSLWASGEPSGTLSIWDCGDIYVGLSTPYKAYSDSCGLLNPYLCMEI